MVHASNTLETIDVSKIIVLSKGRNVIPGGPKLT